MENRIDAVIDAATLKKITDSIDSVKTDLPFLVELSLTEARRLAKMEDGRVVMVQKALSLAVGNSMLIPQFFELAAANKDISLCVTLDEIIVKERALLKMLEDTRALSGSEAYAAALEIYNTAKRGAKKGIPGMQSAYDELKVFYEGQGNSGQINTPVQHN